MSAMNNPQFAEHVLSLAKGAPRFEPTATYDPDGDCIEFLTSPDPFYAERVDDLVTVYYSQETKEIVGSLIKGVTKFCREVLEKLPGFKIEIQDGGVKLEHIFLAKLWASNLEPGSVATVTYRKLIAIAGRSEAKAELACA